jgi:hypothetical protein
MTENKDTKIGKFHLSSILDGDNPYKTIAIIGPHGSGKTTIIRGILNACNHRIRYPILFCGSSSGESEYDDVVPNLLTYDSFDTKILTSIFSTQSMLKKKLDESGANKNIKDMVVVILDDIIGTNKDWKSSPQAQKLISAGRHFMIFTIISIQSPLFLPPQFRDNMDFIFCTNIQNEQKRKKFYDQYVDSQLATYKSYEAICKNIYSIPYEFLVLDKCSKNKSKVMFHGTISKSYLKKRRIGIEYIWRTNELYYNKDYLIQGTNTHETNVILE